ncbi:hypothetical protein BSKO_10293 [Bryopsis sp. KO-2023]|nr:hypothetical protein BSKO_10293 [Bryopsis sp. KO-2023]
MNPLQTKTTTWAAAPPLHKHSRQKCWRCLSSKSPSGCPVGSRRTLLATGTLGLGLAAAQRDQSVAQDSIEIESTAETVGSIVPLSWSLLVLRNSLPQLWVQEFQRLVGNANKVKVKSEKTLEALYVALKSGKAKGYDLVSIGDAFLAPCIQGGYLKPIEGGDDYRWFGSLPERWKTLVVRDGDGLANPRGGRIWGVPYRWGCTVIAYREDKLKKNGVKSFEDWSDLLHPKLKSRIAFLDSPREFIGMAQKSLGLSYNDGILEMQAKGVSEEKLKARVKDLKAQILTFSNSDHVRALAAEDAWIAVGSSSDLLPLAGANSNLRFLVPGSGTALWSDVFVQPSQTDNPDAFGTSPMLNVWLDFVLSPARTHGGGLQGGVAPLELPEGAVQEGVCEGRDVELDSRGRFLPSDCVLRRSEFLLPADRETVRMYQRILMA